MPLQVLMNALLSSEGGEGGVVNDRHVERQNYCDASLFNKERSRQGAALTSAFSFIASKLKVNQA